MGEKRPRSILFVENDESLIKSLKRRFKDSGLETWYALDGTAAVELAERHRPDVVIVDWFLDCETGAEVVERLHGRYRPRLTVLITGAGWPPAMLARAAVVRAVPMHKPLDMASLQEIYAVAQGTTWKPYTLAYAEWLHMRATVDACGGNRVRAAELLGVDPRTIDRNLTEKPPLMFVGDALGA